MVTRTFSFSRKLIGMRRYWNNILTKKCNKLQKPSPENFSQLYASVQTNLFRLQITVDARTEQALLRCQRNTPSHYSELTVTYFHCISMEWKHQITLYKPFNLLQNLVSFLLSHSKLISVYRLQCNCLCIYFLWMISMKSKCSPYNARSS